MRRSFSLLAAFLCLLVAGCDVDPVSVVVTDSFPIETAPVDVLWVIDNTNSMGDIQTAVGAAFPSFLAPLTSSAVEWRVGITTTDVVDATWRGRLADLGGGAVFADPTTGNPSGVFASAAQVGLEGSNLERGLQAAWWAVTPPLTTHENLGFLRDDARLAVVVVSDEDDCSDEGALTDEQPGSCAAQPNALVPTTEYLARLRSLKDDPLDVSVFALVETGVTGEFEGCGGSTPGSRYIDLARRTGGEVWPLCGDFDATLGELGEGVAGLRRAFPLGRTPDPATLEVSRIDLLGGLPVAVVEDPTRTDGWTWDSASNSIRLWGLSEPLLGETVTVRYEVGNGI